MRTFSRRDGLLFFPITETEAKIIPFIPTPIKAGFPSPAQDFMEEDIDLVAFLGMNKPSCYIVRVSGDSMQDEHVPDNSYLVVDRSLKPIPHDIVVAVLNNEFTVKTLVKAAAGWMLYPANATYSPIVIHEGDDFQVWGVVAQVIIDRKEMRKRY